MSSSFTNQPSPHDPQPDEGYTPTPPRPERGRGVNEGEAVGPRPKLGSLAQKARGDKLKQARNILFFVGGATLVSQVIFLARDLNQGADVLIASAIYGLFIMVGILFLVFGALLNRFPVPITIISLVVYILVSLIDLGLAALFEPAAMAGGLVWKIIFIVALASSIKSAVAYEKERHAEEEYTYDE